MNIHNSVAEFETDGQAYHPIFADAPKAVEFNKLRKRLLRQTRQAIDDFTMAKPGERWLVALSGGKDSYGLLTLLLDLKWRGLLPVDLLACNLDQGQPNFPKHILPDWLTANGVPHRIEYRDTYSIVTDKLPRELDLLFAMLSSQARPPLPYRAGGGMFRPCPGTPSGRYSRNLLHEPLSRRPAGGDAGRSC